MGEVLTGIHDTACSNRLSLLWIWRWINAKRQGRWISFLSGPLSVTSLGTYRHTAAVGTPGSEQSQQEGERGGADPVEISSIIAALRFKSFFFLFRGHFLQMWFTMIKDTGLYYCSNLVTALPISRLHVCVTVVRLVGGIYS